MALGIHYIPYCTQLVKNSLGLYQVVSKKAFDHVGPLVGTLEAEFFAELGNQEYSITCELPDRYIHRLVLVEDGLLQ